MQYTDQDITEIFAQENAHPPTEKPEPPPPRLTALGTPCARTWDDDWVAFVEHREAGLDRRICGAHTPAGKPCMLESNHSSGRCRFHGGFDLTGAPEGNRNAVIHSLYSRRLTICGKHCPAWDTCPLGGGKIQADRAEAAARLKKEKESALNNASKKPSPQNEHTDGDINVMDFRKNSDTDLLSLPPDERPTCPYEQTEYNAAVTDATQSAWTREYADPYSKHVAHTLALVQVMVSRAALALRHQGFTETIQVVGKNYSMQTNKPSAPFTAFLKLQREYRQLIALTRPKKPDHPFITERVPHELRSQTDTRIDPDAPPPLSPAEIYAIQKKAPDLEHEHDTRGYVGLAKERALLVKLVEDQLAGSAAEEAPAP